MQVGVISGIISPEADDSIVQNTATHFIGHWEIQLRTIAFMFMDSGNCRIGFRLDSYQMCLVQGTSMSESEFGRWLLSVDGPLVGRFLEFAFTQSTVCMSVMDEDA